MLNMLRRSLKSDYIQPGRPKRGPWPDERGDQEMEMKRIGSVESLWRYPVKSMMGEEIANAYFTERGMLGDRSYALVDKATGKVVSAKNPRKWRAMFSFSASYITPPQTDAPISPVKIELADGTSIRSDSPNVNTMIGNALDREVRLACDSPAEPTLEEYWPDLDRLAHRAEVTEEAMPTVTFFDCGAVHVVTTATLAKLGELYPEGRFEPKRFRPNLLIAVAPPASGFAENEWVGKTLAIGSEVRMKITGNTGRCVMTTLPQGDLPHDAGILRTAAQHNRTYVGVYAEIVRSGTTHRGDEIRML
jgi:uncharacterized protein YcbX